MVRIRSLRSVSCCPLCLLYKLEAMFCLFKSPCIVNDTLYMKEGTLNLECLDRPHYFSLSPYHLHFWHSTWRKHPKCCLFGRRKLNLRRKLLPIFGDEMKLWFTTFCLHTSRLISWATGNVNMKSFTVRVTRRLESCSPPCQTFLNSIVRMMSTSRVWNV
uniref:Secreted protein n=1 Tax=Cacopsylla melanoneura TaxID=428564 RepID=A0A8D8XC57_9HEMI